MDPQRQRRTMLEDAGDTKMGGERELNATDVQDHGFDLNIAAFPALEENSAKTAAPPAMNSGQLPPTQHAKQKGSWSDRLTGKQPFQDGETQNKEKEAEAELDKWAEGITEEEMKKAFEALNWHQPEKKGSNPLRIPLDMTIAKRTFSLLSKAGQSQGENQDSQQPSETNRVAVTGSDDDGFTAPKSKNDKRSAKRSEELRNNKDQGQCSNVYIILETLSTEEPEDHRAAPDVAHNICAENDRRKNLRERTEDQPLLQQGSNEGTQHQPGGMKSGHDKGEDPERGSNIPRPEDQTQDVHRGGAMEIPEIPEELLAVTGSEKTTEATPFQLLQLDQQKIHDSQRTEEDNSVMLGEQIRQFQLWKTSSTGGSGSPGANHT
ncbi:hypothetical protein R1sor_016757 [Riccia sorocarpa]|uniref:Uncharacterized protein n=1 Tax=Riccia sorocarpa TaxID=122646 RepID=A0ABD3HGC1_9MARC